MLWSCLLAVGIFALAPVHKGSQAMAQKRTRKRAPDVDSAKPLCSAVDARVLKQVFFVSDQSAGSTDKGPDMPKTTIGTAVGSYHRVTLDPPNWFSAIETCTTGLGLESIIVT